MAPRLVSAFVWREMKKRETRAEGDGFVFLEETNFYPVADAFPPLDCFLPLLLLVFLECAAWCRPLSLVPDKVEVDVTVY